MDDTEATDSANKLGQTAARGGLVTVAGQVVKMTVQMVGLVVLSRLLEPVDFGLVAMLMAIVALGELVRDFGLTHAAMQTRILTPQQATNIFWINLALGCALSLLFLLSTPLLVEVFDEPRLKAVAPYLAIVMVANSAQAQYQVRMARAFQFRKLVITDVFAQIVALAIGIGLASEGAGYWSLVAQILVASILMLVTRVLQTRWLPGLPRKTAGMSRLLRFGANLGAAQVLTYGASNTDTYVIGTRWGAQALGVYNRAFQLLLVPVTQLLSPLTNVFLPVLSKSNNSPSEMYRLLARAQFVVGLGAIFLFATAAGVADSMIALALGEQWSESAAIFRILALGGIFQVLSFVGYWAFLATGSAGALLRYNVITKLGVVLLVVSGSVWGLEGVAWGYSLGLAISWPICLIWLSKRAGMPGLVFFRSGLRLLSAGVAGFALALLFSQWLGDQNAVLTVLSAGSISLIAFLAVIVVFPSSRDELTALVSSVRRLRALDQ